MAMIFFNTDNTVKSDRQFDNKHPFLLRETQICHELDLLQDQTGAVCSPLCPESTVHHHSGCMYNNKTSFIHKILLGYILLSQLPWAPLPLILLHGNLSLCSIVSSFSFGWPKRESAQAEPAAVCPQTIFKRPPSQCLLCERVSLTSNFSVLFFAEMTWIKKSKFFSHKLQLWGLKYERLLHDLCKYYNDLSVEKHGFPKLN